MSFTIQDRFEEFHRDHPQVYVELVKLTEEAKAAGRERVGIGMLWEVLRWNINVLGPINSTPYKLNDNYRSRYARLIMKNEPQLASMFETRALISA